MVCIIHGLRRFQICLSSLLNYYSDLSVACWCTAGAIDSSTAVTPSSASVEVAEGRKDEAITVSSEKRAGMFRAPSSAPAG